MIYRKFQIVKARVKNEDLIAVCKSTLEILYSFEDELDELLKGMIVSLEKALEKFNIHIKSEKASRLTPKVNFLDTERDKNWIEIKRTIALNLTLRNLNKSNAAKIIDEFLTPYGNVKALPFEKQTQVIREMIKAFKEKKDISEAIIELDIMHLFEELDHWNENFDAIFIQRQLEYEEERQVKYKEVRQTVVLTYVEICTHLEHLINFPSNQKYKCTSCIFDKMDQLRKDLIEKYQ